MCFILLIIRLVIMVSDFVFLLCLCFLRFFFLFPKNIVIFIYLFIACLFSKEHEKEVMELDEWGGEEDLEGHVWGNYVIRMNPMKNAFQFKKLKNVFSYSWKISYNTFDHVHFTPPTPTLSATTPINTKFCFKIIQTCSCWPTTCGHVISIRMECIY